MITVVYVLHLYKVLYQDFSYVVINNFCTILIKNLTCWARYFFLQKFLSSAFEQVEISGCRRSNDPIQIQDLVIVDYFFSMQIDYYGPKV